MSRNQNSAFICERCHHNVLALTNGSFRNHCPVCLWSKHVDNLPGDRASQCRGKMKPIAVIRHKKKGWQLVHHCQKCGHQQNNIIAQDTEQPDDMSLIIVLMASASLKV